MLLPDVVTHLSAWSSWLSVAWWLAPVAFGIWTTPRTYVAGEVHAASTLNTDHRDNISALRTGALALSGQAAMDDMYASSTTQWAAGARQLRQTFSGLVLRTHPDADKAASQILLEKCDEMVFHDGTRVANISNLTADITVSGANGLDAGAEGASRFYSAWVIRKSSDGTLGLLLHRAKDYFLDEANTTEASDSALRDASGQTKRAQTFDVDVSGTLERVAFKLKQVGTVTGNVWVAIYATTAGLPTGAALKTSVKLNAALISASDQVIEFDFMDPATPTAGVTYAAVLEGDYTINASNYISFRRSSTDAYAAGQLCAYDGATWTGSAVDAWFRVYITQNDTTLTLPGDYDQYCLVHPGIYNDSGSNFDPCTAQDRRVTPGASATVAAVTATVPTLTDLSAFVPPVPVRISMLVLNDTSGAFVAMGPVVGGHETTNVHRASGCAVFRAAAASDRSVLDVQTAFQALYLRVSAGTGDFLLDSWEW